jgi:DNA helicase II / ATP-dependent DNA helicase PcrA
VSNTLQPNSSQVVINRTGSTGSPSARRDPQSYLADLNPAQRQAVEHGIERGSISGSPPLLVIAGAGSGKTKTLAHRVAHLVVNGVNPRRILLLTFSRRAAEEMTGRARRITQRAVGVERLDLSWSGTFHAIGARLLREFAGRIGLKPSFTILDRADGADLMNLVRQDLNLANKDCPFPKKDTCLSIYSRVVNSMAPLDKVLIHSFSWCLDWEAELRNLFRAYVEAKQEQNVLDYDDLLQYWAEMMEIRDLAAEIGKRFDHVLVDEYQDTNRLQVKILTRLKPDGRGMMVVGDDAQAIYSFRAATVRNILEFPGQFLPRARVVTLEQNYRSTQPILDACNAVIGLAKRRFTKNLRSDRQSGPKPLLTTVPDEFAQAEYVARQILRSREEGVPLKSQAVLFRASSHSAQLEAELTQRNIPYVKYGGLKFLESAHIKDVLSVLRWCENPTDRVAGFRVVQLLPRIGPSTAAKVLNQLKRQPGLDLRRIQVPKAAAEHWPKLAKVVATLKANQNGWSAEFELVRRWYEPQLPDLYEDHQDRAADIAQLVQIASRYRSRRQFLTELTLDPPNGSATMANRATDDEDPLVLSTIHSAKGREWRIVRILSVIEGCIPSSMAGTDTIEEERRLLYVAMTRAKDRLELIVPQQSVFWQAAAGDGHTLARISRFLPASILDRFDRRHWSPKTGGSKGTAQTKPGPVVDLAARASRIWE